MVALSKLLGGALIQCAYGNAQLEDKPQNQYPAITYKDGECETDDENGYLSFVFDRDGEKCYLSQVRLGSTEFKSLVVQAACAPNGTSAGEVSQSHKYFNVSTMKAVWGQTNQTIFGYENNGSFFAGKTNPTMYHGNESHGCIKVGTLMVPISFTNVSASQESVNVDDLVVQLFGAKGEEVVANSALFGTAGGEWDIIDLVATIGASVLALCLGLALYGCWAKKQREKDEAGQREEIRQPSNIKYTTSKSKKDDWSQALMSKPTRPPGKGRSKGQGSKK